MPINIEATCDDHVLEAIDNEEIAPLVELSDVAGAEERRSGETS